MSRRLAPALVLSLVAACGLGPDEALPGPEPTDEHVMRGFSWVVDGRLAGMPRPGGRGALDADLAFISDRVELLVSLVEDDTVVAAAPHYGLETLHLPVRDFTAPTQAQLRTFVDAAGAAHARGEAVGVHCGAGLGRTGTFLAAYFVAQGMDADAAIAHVRALRPGSIETATQLRAIQEFAAWGQTLAPSADPSAPRAP